MVAPIIDSVVHDKFSLQINFDKLMQDENSLRNPLNYLVTANEAGAVDCYVISVIPDDDPAGPLFVTLEIGDLTNNKDYLLTIIPNKIRSKISIGGEYLVAPGNTDTFTGISDIPIVQTARALSLTEFEIIFSKDMSPIDLDNPMNYVFDKGLDVLTVTVISPRVVKLLTSKQIPSELYTLAVL